MQTRQHQIGHIWGYNIGLHKTKDTKKDWPKHKKKYYASTKQPYLITQRTLE
jgi:hypothetical protein